MHKKFDSGSIEKKWQTTWDATDAYALGERDTTKEKEYILVEWPYPSGNLHIGHWYAFAVPDIYVRFRRMQGKQVLFPMGFDAFGLPAENAAIKRNLNPKDWTDDNIAYMKEQLNSMGNAFSWDKTTSSTDPEYYKWTQWMFTEFFRNNIAYRGKGIVNWCPGCNTVIANEQVLPNNTCERSGDVIEKREMPQWMLRITQFADRLVDDLDPLEWPEHIKEAQRQWIGRSKGAEIEFKTNTDESIRVFTTRADTLFGATYLVIAPEHPFIEKHTGEISNIDEVRTYIKEATQKDEQDRLDATKEKTGVRLEGVSAHNPITHEEIPVYIADYVLGGYGTGAIMAVPAHDERDHAFSLQFKLPIKHVVGKQFSETGLQPTSNRIGVYALIKNDKDEFLVQHFVNKDFYWIPGGGLEAGETEIDCLTREVKEETGYTDFTITRKVTELVYDYESFRTDTRETGRNKTVVYEVKLNTNQNKGVTLTEDEARDGLELLWMSRDDIAKLTPKFQAKRVPLIVHAIDAAHGALETDAGVLINSGEFDGLSSEEAKIHITEKVGGELKNTYRLRDWSIGRQRYWGVPIPIVYDKEGNAHPVPKEHLPWTLPTDVDFTPTGVAPLAKSKELKARTEAIFGEGWTPEVETMDTFVDSSWYFLRYIDNHNDFELSSKASQNEWMQIDTYFGGAEHTTMHLLYSRFWQKALFDMGLVVHSEPYKRRVNRGLILGPDGNKMSKSKGNVIDPDEQVKRVGADTVKMYLAFMGPYEGSNYPFDLGGIAGVRRFLERVYGLSEHIRDTEIILTKKLLHRTIVKVTDDIALSKFNTAISAMMIFINQAEKEGLMRQDYETFLLLLAPFAPHLTEELWEQLGKSTSIHSESFPTADSAYLTDESMTISVQVNGKMKGTIVVPRESTEADILESVQNDPTLSTKVRGVVNRVIYVKGRLINLILGA